MSTASSTVFEDVKVGVRLKMSALWIGLLLLIVWYAWTWPSQASQEHAP